MKINLIFRLLRVAEATDCKMPVTNLAKIFGPTIIGYSCPEPDPESALKQLKKQHSVSPWLILMTITIYQISHLIVYCFSFHYPDHGKTAVDTK